MELSSVRLIIAEGGKREEGTLKEKKAPSPLVRPAKESGVTAPEDGGEDEAKRTEKKVKKLGSSTRTKRNRTNRGNRMMP